MNIIFKFILGIMGIKFKVDKNEIFIDMEPKNALQMSFQKALINKMLNDPDLKDRIIINYTNTDKKNHIDTKI